MNLEPIYKAPGIITVLLIADGQKENNIRNSG